jgi:flagellar basal-body rod protein FlgB
MGKVCFWFKNEVSDEVLSIGIIIAQLSWKIVSIWNALMSKINEIFDVLGAGIRAETARQKTIANNVANSQTPGYRRVDVKFQDLLADAMDSKDVNFNELTPEILQPNETTVNSEGNDVNLEMEVGNMVKNSLQYKTYVKILQKKYQQIESAINI